MPELFDAENVSHAFDHALKGRAVAGVELLAPALLTLLTQEQCAAQKGRTFTTVY